MTEMIYSAAGIVVGLIIKYGWDMLTKGDRKYLTRKECTDCASHKQHDDIVAIKQLLLIVVVKLNIPPEDYQNLVGMMGIGGKA